MPTRLIGLIVILTLLLVFIGFNLDNRCDISFGFAKFPDVPIYLTVFASFMLGMFLSLIFFLFKAIGGKDKKPARPRGGRYAGGGSGGDSGREDTLPRGNDGPYGID
ncbi:MAG: hypothetical protein LBQ44_02670 [Treponema sp.]|jgi:uncharacterized integral membrane protein|nr:hypothetical protein [Treponema sp.]